MKGVQIAGAIVAVCAIGSVRLGLFGTKMIHVPLEYHGSSHLSTVFGERLEILNKDEKVIETHYSILPISLAPPEGYEFSSGPVFVKKD